MENISVEIGSRIRELRIAKEMSQEELAQRLGYKHRSSVNKIETGAHNLTQSKIKLIADVLGVSPMYIMGWEDMPEDNPLYKKLYSKTDSIESAPEGYYTNPETAEIAQEIFDDPDLRTLFHVARNASPEQLKLAKEMLEMMKKNGNR